MKAGAAPRGPRRRRALAAGNVVALDRLHIERALPQRTRYRYVQPRVLAQGQGEGAGWVIASPNCSRSIDPAGGEILIAWFEPQPGGRWRLHARDHHRGAWVLQAVGLALDEAVARVVADPVGQFWP